MKAWYALTMLAFLAAGCADNTAQQMQAVTNSTEQLSDRLNTASGRVEGLENQIQQERAYVNSLNQTVAALQQKFEDVLQKLEAANEKLSKICFKTLSGGAQDMYPCDAKEAAQ
jgi:DNA-binding FrmR family transcriptional regulator